MSAMDLFACNAVGLVVIMVSTGIGAKLGGDVGGVWGFVIGLVAACIIAGFWGDSSARSYLNRKR